MEDCIDIKDYNGSPMVKIKQPGSTRHRATGEAVTFIECTLPEAVALAKQIMEKAGSAEFQ